MKTKYITGAIILAFIVFFGGFALGKAKVSASAASAAARAGQFAGRTGAAAGRAGGAQGTILKVEAGDVVISTAGGGSKVVLVGTSTPVEESVSGSISDLAAGQTILVTGASNSDGSVSASSIDVRPTQQLSR